MARKVCEDCGGDGKSQDPFWKACWLCCGRGDYPTKANDVRRADIGNGVGAEVKYSRDQMSREQIVLTGNAGNLAIVAELVGTSLASCHASKLRPGVEQLLELWLERRTTIPAAEVDAIVDPATLPF